MASTGVLAADVTLADLRKTIPDAEEFVRLLLAAMNAERKSRGEITVRIGRTGAGRAPNYRFDSEDGEPLVPYNGADHKPWPPGEDFTKPGNWSSVAWTYDEVAALRGELEKRR